MEIEGFYNIGEMINRIIPGCVNAVSDDDVMQPQPLQLFFTSVGRIGIISNLPDTISRPLIELQRNLSNTTKGVGQTNHSEWRRPNTTRGPTDLQAQAVGFLDGDFLEQYLIKSDYEQRQIHEGKGDAEVISMNQQELVQVLEKLVAVH